MDRRSAAARLALLVLELEELQSEQRSLQLQHEIAEVNSEQWHQLVLSRADLQDYAWGLEREIERLREEVALRDYEQLRAHIKPRPVDCGVPNCAVCSGAMWERAGRGDK
jgi:hypothetical protein